MMEPMKKLNDQARVEEQEVTTKDIGSKAKMMQRPYGTYLRNLNFFNGHFPQGYMYIHILLAHLRGKRGNSLTNKQDSKMEVI